MKTLLVAVLSILLVSGCSNAKENLTLKDEKDKVSYGIGFNIGKDFKTQSVEITPEILLKGIKDALAGGTPMMTEQEMQVSMTNFRKEMSAKLAEKAKVDSEKNKKEGEAFLVENKTKEGVKTTASGLQYKIIKEGNGPQPKVTDTVTVNYSGTFINGTEFDSSYKRGEPASFPLNGVIPGWIEALQLMKVGSKWQIFLPSDLAYGENSMQGSPIGPNSTLIFDVELLSIGDKVAVPDSHK